MRLTRQTDYALRTLIYLSLHEDRLCTISEIAETYDISRNHLMKVVQRLGALGFAETLQGRSGGLRLARASEAINVGEVVRAFEDDMALVECFDPATNECIITGACGLQATLRRALSAFLAVLGEYSLADIARSQRKLRRLLDAHA